MPDTTRLTAALGDRYVIERELGQGGMATVYLAKDVKHDRDVALKVLRPDLAAVLGAERFLNEIKITARLDHPHILTLIDSGAADGFLYYVLPLVRGESLRDRLDRDKQLGIDDAVAITRQVAAALDYAHRQGVIHRDIKPENILIQEGEAMLADFGIALAVREAGGGRLTETGLSLGTPQYMSPEQATGERDIDGRSDVYSLAAVLYEMLAGEPPVTGPTVQAIIAKLLTERPTRLRVVRDTVPEGLDDAVAKALARTPADRFASAGAFAAALTQAARAPELPAGRRAPRPGRGWMAGAAGLVVLLAAGFGAWRMMRAPAPALVIGRSEQFTTDPGLEIQPAISPDGKLVAYAAGTSTRMRIFIRPVGGGRTFPLSDDSTAVETQPRWSPDGASILFLTRGGASVAPALGGSSRPVVAPSQDRQGVLSAAWSPDGREIAFVRADSLLVSDAAGRQSRLLTTAPQLHSCAWSPGGTWIACVSLNGEALVPGAGFGNIAPSALVLVPAGGGAPLPLMEAKAFNQSPAWSPDGAWLYFVSDRDGPRDVYALSLSASGQPRGQPVRLTTGLGALSIAVSADQRRLVYAVYTAKSNIWSLPLPRGAAVTTDRAVQVTRGNQVVESMRVSRDGRWLLYDSDLKGNADAWRIPIGGGPPEQLTSDSTNEFGPDLSPDGRKVAYHSWHTGTRDIEVKPLDGGPVQRVTATPSQESWPIWSADGDALLFWDQAPPSTAFVTRRSADGRWSPPQRLETQLAFPEWSPDGREIAYLRPRADALYGGQLQVMPAAGGPARIIYQLTPDLPRPEMERWSVDGRTIYFLAHDAAGQAVLWEVSAAGGRPRQVVRFTDPDRQTNRPFFAVSATTFYFAISDRQSDVFVAELLRK
jgi:serine/threonine-protein kinase